MDITFTRCEGRTYKTVARRDDGVVLQVPSYDRLSLLPHDLAHYVVEHGLGLKRGFWGCVADGALFPGIVVVSGRSVPHAGARSRAVIREAGQHGTEAEVFVEVLLRIMHEGLEPDASAVRAALTEMWRPSRPSRALPDVEEARRLCAALREMQERWHLLETGQSLTVTWPSHRHGSWRSRL
jgi:hypothetical protein